MTTAPAITRARTRPGFAAGGVDGWTIGALLAAAMRRRSHRRGAGPRRRTGQPYLGASDRHGSRPLCRDDPRPHGRASGRGR